MKRFYSFLLAVLTVGVLNAQESYDVTFRVDMSNETVAAEGVHVAGSFQGWDAAGTMLSDDDMDNIYEITLSLEAGDYEFKFINGNDWPFEEVVPDACRANLDGNTNRMITVDSEMTYEVCFGSCAACGLTTVLFRVDMSLEDAVAAEGVHVAGNFQGWDPGATMLSDEDGDNIHTVSMSFDAEALDTPGELAFKFINGNSWLFPNESVSTDCGSETGDRLLTLEDLNVVTDAYCFNLCGPCVAPLDVTFQVNMNNETVAADGVFIAGAFQGWSDNSTQMTDDDADGVYEYTTQLAPGTYQFKFLNGAGGWEAVPGDCATDGNRVVEIIDEAVSYISCYNQCSEDCVTDPDPADITFRVDMSDEVVSADGVYVMGQFTDPQWQEGAVMMTDDNADGVYEATLTVSGSAEFQYKFTNGDPYPGDVVDATVEEAYDFVTGNCGVENGIGGFNRVHVRSGVAETLDIVCYNSCVACGVGVNGITIDNTLSVFPNPTNGNFVINSEVINGMAFVSVVDAQGRLVRSNQINFVPGNNVEMNIADLPNGVYAIRIENQKVIATTSVVKK